ncbi:MAG TPA: hypothetical protein PJ982_17720 [Lacipirellulaceae bacterium]|nr:hypothetical protein [Lacipirellulaceae bacterium]
MVAPLCTTKRIICTAIRVDGPRSATTDRLSYKPSELVPWADPYIAGLVRRLQSEVHFERASRLDQPRCDLEPAAPALEPDWDSWDQPRWSGEDGQE